MSPVTKWALGILDSGLRRKEASALLARVESLVLVLTQGADGRAWFADLRLCLIARQVEPPPFDDCTNASHGITTGLSPTETAENDKHL